MSGFSPDLLSQNDVCGMDNEVPSYIFSPPVQMAQSNPPDVIDIPIHIYVLHTDEGVPPHPFA